MLNGGAPSALAPQQAAHLTKAECYHDSPMIEASVRKSAFILFVSALLVPVCRAEARWCDVLGHGDGDKILYPPIARAASISGAVLLRITYTPQGDVKDVVNISGPRLLATPVATQLKTWRLKTNALGDELCQSLAIIDFRIASPAVSPARPPQPVSGSIFHVSVVTEPIVLYTISDPAPKRITRCRRFFLF
jgi:hypothetical protein